jgi:hypothetical protein
MPPEKLGEGNEVKFRVQMLPECTSTFTWEAFPTGPPYINGGRKLPQLFCPM